jgi:hypothetical protein
MAKIVINFSINDDLLPIYAEFKKIAAREGKTMSELIREFILDYVKKHGEGNPIYKLDKWQDNPSFKAYPALDSDWEQANLSAFDDNDLQHIAQKAREILHFASLEARKRGLTV